MAKFLDTTGLQHLIDLILNGGTISGTEYKGLNDKVDKETNKGLSTNDFTNSGELYIEAITTNEIDAMFIA